jgi:hypothetical protein
METSTKEAGKTRTKVIELNEQGIIGADHQFLQLHETTRTESTTSKKVELSLNTRKHVPDRFPYFANRLLSVRLPHKFKPSNHSKYGGKTEPKQWLRIYSQSIELAGGDDDIKAR